MKPVMISSLLASLALGAAAGDFNIVAFGAKPDGTKCTEAFAGAMAACETSGGGRVVVPKGRWFSGAIRFRSNCELHLEEGAEILFSQDPDDYLPVVHTSWEGMECWNYCPLVYAYCCTNVAITGTGTLRAYEGEWKDTFWYPWVWQENGIRDARRQLYDWGATDYPVEKRQIWRMKNAHTRPHFVQFNRCKGVRWEDFKVRNSPFWTLHLYMCEGAAVRGLDVYAHGNNNDGIDIEMSRDVLVEDCVFDQGDDGVVIKSGRNRDAWRLHTPTENVLVRNCRIVNAHTIFGIGSEISGGVRNVRMENCTGDVVMRAVYIKTNHRRGGFVENVSAANIACKEAKISAFEIGTDILYEWAKFPEYETAITEISDISVSNLTCGKAASDIRICGDGRKPVRNVRVKGLKVGEITGDGRRLENVEGFVCLPDEFAIPWAEFAKYHVAVTGREPAADAVRFAIDPTVSRTGNDAYTIRSDAKGAVLTGSNARSVLYAVYDLLERRAGCRWFWDADIVPKRTSIDLSGLDVSEESQFRYRGTRYFAHRGLTRFQAEHWGPEDWKREIDWCAKKRLNVMMLRIGQDDVFQRAFPDVCAYPDPAKPLPATGRGYDNRSLFWPLEFRGKLREQVVAYAQERGLLVPEDSGTMTHWYSRTPLDFVQKMKPDYFTEKTECYNDGKGTGLVWDIRQQKWIDAYWQLTETALRTYDNGDDTLIHAMGVGERKFSDDHEENIRTKLMIDKKVVDEALKRHPNARVLYPGWDFYYQWRGEDVKRFVAMLDPEKTVIWQYTSDSYKEGKSNPLEWGLVGRFPYTFGIFLAYESGLDIRANYDLIRAREAASKDDPFCVGYILWPESSHTDLLAAEYFAANGWRIDDVSTADRIAKFCRDRYGEQAATFEPIWRDVVPVSTNALPETWRSNYGIVLLGTLGDRWNYANNDPSRWPSRPLKPFEKTPEIFRALADIDWQGDVVRRDTVDLARTVGDRLTLAAEQNMMNAYFRWKAGDAAAPDDFERAAADAQNCAELMRRVLVLHTDYSLNDSLSRLTAVEPVRNPDFGQVLLENAVNSYCASHQAEPAEHLYPQIIAHVAAEIRARIRSGSKDPLDAKGIIALKDAFLKRPLASLKSREARTPENYRRTMLDFAAAAERMLGKGSEPDRSALTLTAKNAEIVIAADAPKNEHQANKTCAVPNPTYRL